MAIEHVYHRSGGGGENMSETSNDQLREMLRDLKQRRHDRHSERALPGLGSVTKTDVLKAMEGVLPYITILCILPLFYALWTVWGPGGRARTEVLLQDLLNQVQQLRAEVRALRDAQGEQCAV